MNAAFLLVSSCFRSPGGNIQARDHGRSLTPREWALFTGRQETAALMHQLMSRPCAEQICDSFSLEWPMLEVTERHRAVVLLTHAHSNLSPRYRSW